MKNVLRMIRLSIDMGLDASREGDELTSRAKRL